MLKIIFITSLALISAIHSKSTLIKSEHTYSIDDQNFSYSAFVGKLPAKIDNEELGEIFFTAYFLNDSSECNRPITFIFNGGPGSSSVWLHIGAFGPYRIKFPEEGQKTSAPYELVENKQTLLKYSDLVFVDPLETGFSKVNDKKDLKKCLSVTGDVDILSNWIVDFIACFKRFDSPKFLIGESYGTTRCALISSILQREYGLYLNGIILISCALDFKTFRFSTDNPLPYALLLPSYAAAYWYHEQLDCNLSELLSDVKEYALNEYLPALTKGNSLDNEEKAIIAKKLSSITGISDDIYLKNDLKIDHGFFKQNLKDSETIGLYDFRYARPSEKNLKGNFAIDPSIAPFRGMFTAAINNYFQKNLHYYDDENLFYNILNHDVGKNWSFEPDCSSFLNVRPHLQDSLIMNSDLHVFVVNGIFDLVTPFFASEFTMHNMESLKNVLIKNYESGHMPYIDLKARGQLEYDLKHFYENSK